MPNMLRENLPVTALSIAKTKNLSPDKGRPYLIRLLIHKNPH